MLDLVGNPEDRFSQGAVHIMSCLNNMVFQSSRVSHVEIRCLANLSHLKQWDQRMKRGLTDRVKEKQEFTVIKQQNKEDVGLTII